MLLPHFELSDPRIHHDFWRHTSSMPFGEEDDFLVCLKQYTIHVEIYSY